MKKITLLRVTAKKAFTLMELMIVIVIIGIFATAGFLMFSDSSLKAKKTVSAENYRQITDFIQTESALCESSESNKIFGNYSCPITDSVSGAQSGWCGRFGDYILKKAKFENPFGGSAFGVGDSQQDGITSCVLCNRSPYCSGSETNKKYKLMWWYDNKIQDFTIIAPN